MQTKTSAKRNQEKHTFVIVAERKYSLETDISKSLVSMEVISIDPDITSNVESNHERKSRHRSYLATQVLPDYFQP
mgnify:CR=1 FL=1